MVGLAFGELGYCGVRKKILFVIESLGGGGAEKVLTTIVKHIDKEKFDVTVCPIVGTGTYVEEVKRYANYRPILEDAASLSSLQKIWYRIKYKLIYKVLPMSWVYRLWIPKGYDTEVAFCEGFVTKLMAESTNVGAKKIAWVHIDLKYNPWPQKLGIFKNVAEETNAYSHYDRIVTVSKTVEKSFNEVYYGLADNVQTIYNPIDHEDIIDKSRVSIAGFEQGNEETLNIISVGRLVPQKGYDILLRVASRLKDEGFKFKLRILGEGEQRCELEQYLKSNHLEDVVSLLGFQKNPYPYIANSDLFVCSSRSEGYSLVIAESLVLGVPVVSTYCSGPNELLKEGEYGMLVENDESGVGLYEGIKQFLCNKELKIQWMQLVHSEGHELNVVQPIKDIYYIL